MAADVQGVGGAPYLTVVLGQDPQPYHMDFYVSTTNDNPAAAPVWSDWKLLENAEITARGVRARAVLSTDDPAYTPRVSTLRLIADEVA